MILFLVLAGALLGAVTALWARTATPRGEVRRFAVILVVMQAIYVGFVAVAPSLPALLTEAGLLAVCWWLAQRAWRRSAFYLVAGYALHGLWDLRHALADTGYVPWSYDVACLGYDWLLMAYFLTRIRVWSASSGA